MSDAVRLVLQEAELILQSPPDDTLILQAPTDTRIVSSGGPQGPPGPPGPPGGVVVGGLAKEQPTGAIDGTNKVFTLSAAYAPGSTQVFLNGLLSVDEDYSETSSTTVTFTEAPYVGDRIIVVYVPA